MIPSLLSRRGLRPPNSSHRIWQVIEDRVNTLKNEMVGVKKMWGCVVQSLIHDKPNYSYGFDNLNSSSTDQPDLIILRVREAFKRKKTERYWSFTKTGGGGTPHPRPIYFQCFPEEKKTFIA